MIFLISTINLFTLFSTITSPRCAEQSCVPIVLITLGKSKEKKKLYMWKLALSLWTIHMFDKTFLSGIGTERNEASKNQRKQKVAQSFIKRPRAFGNACPHRFTISRPQLWICDPFCFCALANWLLGSAHLSFFLLKLRPMFSFLIHWPLVLPIRHFSFTHLTQTQTVRCIRF